MKKEIRFKGLRSGSWLLCLSLIFTLLSPAYAEPQVQVEQQYYISPRLQLGLHTKASLDSPIKVLISSGMPVEVITKEKEFSQVKTPEGAEGWVKNKFLTKEQPARFKVEKMQAQLQQARLEDSKTKKTGISRSESESDLIEANKTSENLLPDDEKAIYEETISGLKEELKAWEQLDRQDKLAQEEQAEKTNEQLKAKLAMIASVATGKNIDVSHLDMAVRGELPEMQNETKLSFLKVIKKNYILLLMAAGLSFLLGIFVMDLITRRRHGGYRI